MSKFNNPDDDFIKENLLKQLDMIGTPSVEESWENFRQKYYPEEKKKRFWQYKSGWVAAALVLVMIAAVFKPIPATALGEKIIQTFKAIVGKTTESEQTSYLKEGSTAGSGSEVLQPLLQKEVTLQEAQEIVPYFIAKPEYLPDGTETVKISIRQINKDVFELTQNYKTNDKQLQIKQINITGDTSSGYLYDIEDVQKEEIELNGAKAKVYAYKNDIYKIKWYMRGIEITVKSNLSYSEIVKIANSIK